jgi:hypothetical protein
VEDAFKTCVWLDRRLEDLISTEDVILLLLDIILVNDVIFADDTILDDGTKVVENVALVFVNTVLDLCNDLVDITSVLVFSLLIVK